MNISYSTIMQVIQNRFSEDGKVAYILPREFENLQKEIRKLEEHRDILAAAMAEVKATNDGSSKQSIGKIIQGCIKEIKELSHVHA